VGADAYRHALWLTMRAFYGQRCGCDVNLGGGYAYSKCHLHDAFHASSGKAGQLANHGGWHDAGDYGRYIVNSGITTGTLLWAWELYGDKLKNIDLKIPESHGRTPDFLAEIRWNLNWMLSLQDADGGVWHKQTSEQFCGFIMPQNDRAISYVIGTGKPLYKGTCATADFAAVMAIVARVYSMYDGAFAKRCLDAARKAWTWASANPSVFFHNPSGVTTGAYGDTSSCKDEILWASAELWRTTGDAQYEQAFLTGARSSMTALDIDVPGWNSLASFAYWTYALSDRKGSGEVIERVHTATLQAADGLVSRSSQNSYGNTLDMRDYVWGSNGIAANQSLLLLIANRFHANNEYQEAALGNLHYLLGRNCFEISWATQLGAQAFQHPHHRPSVADGIAAPWPGLLSGGPNRNPADAVLKRLPQAAPMRMWIDDEGAYSCNEVAINWNAPLVFLLAALRA
jgi:endoglucanase